MLCFHHKLCLGIVDVILKRHYISSFMWPLCLLLLYVLSWDNFIPSVLRKESSYIEFCLYHWVFLFFDNFLKIWVKPAVFNEKEVEVYTTIRIFDTPVIISLKRLPELEMKWFLVFYQVWLWKNSVSSCHACFYRWLGAVSVGWRWLGWLPWPNWQQKASVQATCGQCRLLSTGNLVFHQLPHCSHLSGFGGGCDADLPFTREGKLTLLPFKLC